jgi:hypothetical protein
MPPNSSGITSNFSGLFETVFGTSVNGNTSGLNTSGTDSFVSGVASVPPTTLKQDVHDLKVELVHLEETEKALESKANAVTSTVTTKDWKGLIEARVLQLNQSIKDAPQEQFKTIPLAVKSELERLLSL